jgi:hypothetical protein
MLTITNSHAPITSSPILVFLKNFEVMQYNY